MTGGRAAQWGAIARAGARDAAAPYGGTNHAHREAQAAYERRTAWVPTLDPGMGHRARLLAVFTAAPYPLRGRRVATIAGVPIKSGKRWLGRLAGAGLIVPVGEVERSVLDQGWRLS